MFVGRRGVAQHNCVGLVGRTVHDRDVELDLGAVDLDVNEHIIDVASQYNRRSSDRR